eukprot:TRINITY_DN7211_c0_g1_i1.p1 TRINITY_DN7211_c0_g1~~TRINITY_DN7211_c0_g1_i1.p1  ORF type:complete len:140 (-),score=34.44 TRINITY_DN7211_c0_g1_i1:68-487(-)
MADAKEPSLDSVEKNATTGENKWNADHPRNLKSGRFWKSSAKPSHTRNATKVLHTSWAKKQEIKAKKKLVQAKQKETRDAAKREKEEYWKRRRENEERRKINEKKAEVTVNITNSRKLRSEDTRLNSSHIPLSRMPSSA